MVRRYAALRSVESSFAMLTSGVEPLALNGVPLPLLREQLLRRHTPLPDKDWAWRRLAGLARTGDPAWVVGAVGMALPGLQRHARILSRLPGANSDDVAGDLLAGFLDALQRLDVDRPAIAARLVWAARRHAQRQLPDVVAISVPGLDWCADRRRPGHPDLVLVHAVRLGVISDLDARMLAATRLEKAPDDAVAAAVGLGLGAMRTRRHRAAHKLRVALTSGVL